MLNWPSLKTRDGVKWEHLYAQPVRKRLGRVSVLSFSENSVLFNVYLYFYASRYYTRRLKRLQHKNGQLITCLFSKLNSSSLKQTRKVQFLKDRQRWKPELLSYRQETTIQLTPDNSNPR